MSLGYRARRCMLRWRTAAYARGEFMGKLRDGFMICFGKRSGDARGRSTARHTGDLANHGGQRRCRNHRRQNDRMLRDLRIFPENRVGTPRHDARYQQAIQGDPWLRNFDVHVIRHKTNPGVAEDSRRALHNGSDHFPVPSRAQRPPHWVLGPIHGVVPNPTGRSSAGSPKSTTCA